MTSKHLFALLLFPALLLLAGCPPIGECVCPAIDEPVCGVDGVTYGNSCLADCADVDVAEEGPCAGDGDDDDSAE